MRAMEFQRSGLVHVVAGREIGPVPCATLLGAFWVSVAVLERVDKLSTKPGNRVPYLRQKGVQKCFAELTLCVTLSAS